MSVTQITSIYGYPVEDGKIYMPTDDWLECAKWADPSMKAKDQLRMMCISMDWYSTQDGNQHIDVIRRDT